MHFQTWRDLSLLLAEHWAGCGAQGVDVCASVAVLPGSGIGAPGGDPIVWPFSETLLISFIYIYMHA